MCGSFLGVYKDTNIASYKILKIFYMYNDTPGLLNVIRVWDWAYIVIISNINLGWSNYLSIGPSKYLLIVKFLLPCRKRFYKAWLII
jgi:hypothetical protein